MICKKWIKELKMKLKKLKINYLMKLKIEKFQNKILIKQKCLQKN